jgi:hypothetical protein
VTEQDIMSWLANRTIPAISVGQDLGPGVLVSHLVLHLLGRKEPVVAPNTFQLQFEIWHIVMKQQTSWRRFYRGAGLVWFQAFEYTAFFALTQWREGAKML